MDMSGTFALAATGNGIVAILAGILAQYSAGKRFSIITDEQCRNLSP